MNTGGDPGRDDYGLPPVDIEVPDDARDLDRDVHAYHRELRSQRRRTRARRLAGPLTRDGMVLPLLAGCLALTLLGATLLTVFTAGQGTVGGPLAHPGTGTHQPPAPGQASGSLLNAIVSASGRPEPLSDLLIGPALVLALIPPSCGQLCLHDLRQLVSQASQGGAMPYLVGIGSTQVTRLPRRFELGATQALEDSENMVAERYPTAKFRLMAILIRANGIVYRTFTDEGHGFQITSAVRSLKPAASTHSTLRAGGQPTATAMGSPAG